VAVLYAGRVVEVGEVEEVLRRPQHPYTAALMGSIPSLERKAARLAQIDGAMPRPGRLPSGCAFHPRCSASGPRCTSDRPELFRTGYSASACWLTQGGTAA
jgi:peptide/nickel transport system ATP-binding protein